MLRRYWPLILILATAMLSLALAMAHAVNIKITDVPRTVEQG